MAEITPWSEEEIEYLKSNYFELPKQQIANTLKRPISQVFNMGMVQGLTDKKYNEPKPRDCRNHFIFYFGFPEPYLAQSKRPLQSYSLNTKYNY